MQAMNSQKLKLRKQFLQSNSKKNMILGINITEEMQDLFTVNYKTSLKKVTENLNKWKDISCS